MPRSSQSKLARLIIEHIKEHGPMTIDDYITRCMFDPVHGYYTTQTIFGRDGDFITAPEISQLFGECLAVWVLDQWQQIGAPDHIRLIELGPGKGTLMFDLLSLIVRAAIPVDIEVICVEPSDRLREIQAQKLKNFNCQWVTTIHEITASHQPTLLIANEVFDVLPIKQFINGRERCITINDSDQLVFSHIDGDIIEVSPESENMYEAIQKVITNGAALIIDYGDYCPHNRIGDTLRAISNHKGQSIFYNPGESDISHQVDFYQLKEWSNGSLLSQRDFLLKHGIESRLAKLCENLPHSQVTQINFAASRLLAPSAMGERFLTLEMKFNKN